jgi:hypothetical protein
MISSWLTVLVGVWIIMGAFFEISAYSYFYLYLLLIAAVIGIIGAVTTLGILPIIGGLTIAGAMIYLGVIYEFNPIILYSLLRAVLFVLGGSGIILTFEEPVDPCSIELIRIGVGKQEYYNLKNLGINNLEDLVKEKGNEEEVCSIISVPLSQLKDWIEKSEQILTEIEELKKAKLEKDFKKRFKK